MTPIPPRTGRITPGPGPITPIHPRTGRITPGPGPLTPTPGASSSSRQAALRVELPVEVFAAQDDPTRCLGDHVLLEPIGRGGGGVVWRAYDKALHRTVAVKLLRRSVATDTQTLRRFAQEARAAASLQHPAIVGVYAVEDQGDTPYIAMDLVEGETLDRRLTKGALAPRKAVAIAHTIADALDHAHRAGVIHRDLKPGNVILDPHDRPHLMDFGVARVELDPMGLTSTGVFIGTPGYAPPEQVRGDSQRTGPHSDVYSLGAVLYHMLTGEPPFPGERTLDVVVASLRRDPTPPSKLRPELHPDLDTIVLRCLAKPVEQRYPRADQVADDLQRFLDDEPIQARPVGRIERLGLTRTRLVGAGLLGALAVGALAAVVHGAARPAAPPSPSAPEAADPTRSLATARAEAVSTAHDHAAARERMAASEGDAKARDEALAHGLRALETADRWQTLAGEADPAAARAVFEAAMGLGETALIAGHLALARTAFERAERSGFDRAAARAALRTLEASSSGEGERERMLEK